jgi:hypothetical protein
LARRPARSWIKQRGIGEIPLADVKTGNEFGDRIKRNPCPSVANSIGTFQSVWNVGLFAMGERPNFIDLQHLARQIAHGFVHKFGASRTGGNEHPFNGLFSRAGQPGRASDGASLNEATEDLSTFIGCENIHKFLSLILRYTKCMLASNFMLHKKNKKVMGRPKIGMENAKHIFYSARFTPTEAQKIDDAIRRAGLSKSAFIRKRLLATS